MTDLPNEPSDQNVPSAPMSLPNPQKPVTPPVIRSSAGGKEVEGGIVAAPELPLKPVGHEVVLSKEVSEAGVTVHPQTVPVPPPLVSQGVQSVGANVSPHPTIGDAVKLPLTDEQITRALHASVHESMRWLAEWCVRKIKKMHVQWNASNTPTRGATHTS